MGIKLFPVYNVMNKVVTQSSVHTFIGPYFLMSPQINLLNEISKYYDKRTYHNKLLQ